MNTQLTADLRKWTQKEIFLRILPQRRRTWEKIQKQSKSQNRPQRKQILTTAHFGEKGFFLTTAEYAKGRIFAQSGDDDWAKVLALRRALVLFVVVSRQTKKAILNDSLVNKSSSALVCVNLRLICLVLFSLSNSIRKSTIKNLK